MLLAKADRMRAIEEAAMVSQGISLSELMERAGDAVAQEAREMLPGGGRIVVFCGKGNNGGDGNIAAHLLAADKKYDVEVITAPFEIRESLKNPDLVIDAVLGFGLKGPVRAPANKAIETMNSFKAPVLAVDIPSGINSDTGQIEGQAIKADRTITFTCPKAGMAIYPGLDYVGDVRVADIGIDQKIIAAHTNICLGSRATARPLLPCRQIDVHKGDCGRVLVIAGSIGMTGAAALCSQAALASGAGLVILGTPASLNDILEIKLTEVMTKALPETEERSIGCGAIDQIVEMVHVADAVLIGPGLSTHNDTATLVRRLIPLIAKPLVIDADGINALAGHTDLVAKRNNATVLTPHPGELSRLLDMPIEDIQADRLTAAARAADTLQSTVILKGARTVVADADCQYINPTGNPGMATAGTGDVLSGMTAGLIAQGLPSYPASILATYLHGRSGDLAVRKKTELALIANDLLDYLPEAIKELL